MYGRDTDQSSVCCRHFQWNKILNYTYSVYYELVFVIRMFRAKIGLPLPVKNTVTLEQS